MALNKSSTKPLPTTSPCWDETIFLRSIHLTKGCRTCQLSNKFNETLDFVTFSRQRRLAEKLHHYEAKRHHAAKLHLLGSGRPVLPARRTRFGHHMPEGRLTHSCRRPVGLLAPPLERAEQTAAGQNVRWNSFQSASTRDPSGQLVPN